MVEEKRLFRHAVWSGTLSFSLVSIPVNLFSAVRPRHAAMRLLDEDGTPLSRRYFCPADGRELQQSDLVKGYPINDTALVTVEEEELEGLLPDESSDMDVREFVPRSGISPLYFNRPYFLFPAGKSVKAYQLMVRILADEDRAAIATFVMRGRQYLVAVLSGRGALWAETLRFAEELRDPDSLDLPEKQVVKQRVRAMEKTIRALTDTEVPEKYLRDRYAEGLQKIAARKSRRGKDVVEAEAAEEEGGQVDLMAVLKQRLAAQDKG